MYYSLTFGKEKNTWADWGLIASSPPQIPPPEPNKNLVNIPGRHAGPIDLSLVPFGVMTYARVTGSWTFIREEEDRRCACPRKAPVDLVRALSVHGVALVGVGLLGCEDGERREHPVRLVGGYPG